jgi:hypothetical protein
LFWRLVHQSGLLLHLNCFTFILVFKVPVATSVLAIDFSFATAVESSNLLPCVVNFRLPLLVAFRLGLNFQPRNLLPGIFCPTSAAPENIAWLLAGHTQQCK